MINLNLLSPKNNKKGLTLVELVIGVVILSFFVIGVISALTATNTKIAQNSQKAAVHSEATQKLDAVISVLSNGDFTDAAAYPTNAKIAEAVLVTLGYSTSGTEKVELTLTTDPDTYKNAEDQTVIRGWILELKFKNVTVTGYASCTKGVFDKDAEETETNE